jgi:hypothetical protein
LICSSICLEISASISEPETVMPGFAGRLIVPA